MYNLERCERDYCSFNLFFIHMENQLAEILDKVRVCNECTNFDKIFSKAVD